MNSTSVLITGASGFIGSHLVETAVKLGYETWAGVRSTSSREYLNDRRIQTIELNLDCPEELYRQLSTFQKHHEGKTWDYIIHAAGVTKATNEKTFMSANCLTTQHLADTLAKLNNKPRRFVYLSSLSAAQREGMPTGESAATAYGRSKLLAEHYLLNLADPLDVVILRPTAVYGPREKDFLLAIKAMKHHLCLAFGRKQQRLSFIYVKDLCKVAFNALTEGKGHCTYFVSDGQTYTNREVTKSIQQTLGTRHTIRLTLPLWMLKVLCRFGERISQITKHPTLLNNDKYKILKQRDWTCNPSETERALGFKPEYDLYRGLAETISWYKQQLWI